MEIVLNKWVKFESGFIETFLMLPIRKAKIPGSFTFLVCSYPQGVPKFYVVLSSVGRGFAACDIKPPSFVVLPHSTKVIGPHRSYELVDGVFKPI